MIDTVIPGEDVFFVVTGSSQEKLRKMLFTTVISCLFIQHLWISVNLFCVHLYY